MGRNCRSSSWKVSTCVVRSIKGLMAGVTRGIICISRNLLLEEVLKKLGGKKAEYKCYFAEGMYQCYVKTVILTNEENTSGQGMRYVKSVWRRSCFCLRV